LKIIKVGQIYKLKRGKKDNPYKNVEFSLFEDIKEIYNSDIEISPKSLYIIKELFYIEKQITHLLMSDIKTEYSEKVEVDRIYGDFDEKIILRTLKIKNIIE